MVAPVSAADPTPPALASFKLPGATPASQMLINEGIAMLYGFNGGQARAKFAAPQLQRFVKKALITVSPLIVMAQVDSWPAHAPSQ
jgi:hypothetical protein